LIFYDTREGGKGKKKKGGEVVVLLTFGFTAGVHRKGKKRKRGDWRTAGRGVTDLKEINLPHLVTLASCREGGGGGGGKKRGGEREDFLSAVSKSYQKKKGKGREGNCDGVCGCVVDKPLAAEGERKKKGEKKEGEKRRKGSWLNIFGCAGG